MSKHELRMWLAIIAMTVSNQPGQPSAVLVLFIGFTIMDAVDGWMSRRIEKLREPGPPVAPEVNEYLKKTYTEETFASMEKLRAHWPKTGVITGIKEIPE